MRDSEAYILVHKNGRPPFHRLCFSTETGMEEVVLDVIAVLVKSDLPPVIRGIR